MQTLWTRVAQSRGSCRCPQCLSSAPAVSRRAAASATRRPQFWTSSTLWYSGIFAAAATFDAGLKIQRREKWDMAIAEARQELDKAPEVMQPTVKAATENSLEEQSGFEPLEDDDALRDLEMNLDSSSRRIVRPRLPTSTGPTVTQKRLPPQSIYSPTYYKTRAESEKPSLRKLEVMQLSIDLLQLRIWHALYQAGLSQEATSAVPFSYAEQFQMTSGQFLSALSQKRDHLSGYFRPGMARKFLTRPTEDKRLCNYSQDDTRADQNTVHELNRSLRELLLRSRKAEGLSVPATLAKACYLLASSSVPPNVDTYNTLILGFLGMRQYDRVREVIASFKQTSTRPNEVSLSAILNFYTRVNDAHSFGYWLQLMRGKYGGLMRARSDVRVNDSCQGRLIRDPEQPLRVIQLPYPTPIVFNAVINGVLHFNGFGAALTVCRAMSREQWGICVGGLHSLLLDCANRRDWESGQSIWRHIRALQSRRLRRASPAEDNIDIRAFAAMLRLCVQHNRHAEFRTLIAEFSRLHGTRTKELFRHLKADYSAHLNRASEATRYPSNIGGLLDFSTPWSIVDRAEKEYVELKLGKHNTRHASPVVNSMHRSSFEHPTVDRRRQEPSRHPRNPRENRNVDSMLTKQIPGYLLQQIFDDAEAMSLRGS